MFRLDEQQRAREVEFNSSTPTLETEPRRSGRGNNVSRGRAANFSALQLFEDAAHSIFVISSRRQAQYMS